MQFHVVCVANAPGEGERLATLPEKPAPRTIYLLPPAHPKPRRPFPVLYYNPTRAAINPELYYSPDTLNAVQLRLAWRRYQLMRYRKWRWRILLLRQAPSIYYFAFDREGRLIDYNPALKSALRALGRPAPRLGMNVLDMVLPENRIVFEEEMRMVLEGQAIQLQRAVGPRYAEIHLFPLSKARKAYAYYALDTTLYRRLLEAAMTQQTLHETILSHLRDGVILLDENRRVLYLNAAAERLLGEEASALIGVECIIEPHDGPFLYENRPILANSVYLPDGRTLLIIRDLSELWDIEKQHTLLRKAIAEAPYGVLIVTSRDHQLQPLYHNRTYEEWLLRFHTDPLQALYAHLPKNILKRLPQLMAARKNFQVLLRGNRKTAGWTHLLAIFFPIDLEMPQVTDEPYWAIVLQDQSEIYQATQRQQRLERLQHQLILEAQEKERQHLAEELHDNLGMLLSVLKMELSAVLQDIPAGSPLRTRLQSLSARLDEVVQTVRLTSHQLMPPLVEHFGLIPSLEGLLRRFRATTAVNIHLQVTGEEADMPLIKVLQVYRIVQELITNALRHAQAENIHIRLHYQRNRLIVEVWDDGKGYDPASVQREGIGLRNILGRLQVLRAHWENLSAPGRGARYRIEIPLPRKKS